MAVTATAPQLSVALLDRCDFPRAKACGDGIASAAPDSSQPISVRAAMLHMIEETARHLGHLDILRELTDGVTGE